jgi:hypothetical protein
VQQLLEHNAQLRSELNQVRMEQAMSSASEQIISSENLLDRGLQAKPDNDKHMTDIETLKKENQTLKVCNEHPLGSTTSSCCCHEEGACSQL